MFKMATCVKYLLFAFNFIFVICGLALIVIGALFFNKDHTALMDNKYITGPAILIVTGVVIFMIAFIGCYGSVRENNCMIIIFGLLLLVIFFAELGGGIFAYIHRSEVKMFLKKNMNATIAQQKKDAKKVWDVIQVKFTCCGVDGPNDYTHNGVDIPKTCCNASETSCDVTKAYQNGCYQQVLTSMKSEIGIIAGVAVGVAAVELLGSMLAFYMSCQVAKEV